MEEDGEMEFPAFPYEPYSIQLDFMKFLYQSLNRGGLSMLESPTGTGKTLSMICSALQWLVDRKKLESNGKEKLGESNDDDEPDWVRNFIPIKEPDVVERKNAMQKRKNGSCLKERGESVRDLSSFSSGDGEKGKGNVKEERSVEGKGGVDEVDDGEFLLEEYDSESVVGGKSKRKNVGMDDMFSSEEEDEVDDLVGKEEES